MSATRIGLTRVGRRTSTVLVAALLSLTTAAAGSPGLPNNTVTIDRAVIGCQVQEALALGERARRGLSSPAATDHIAAIHKLLDTMYRQVRLALGNLKDRKGRVKLPDPVLDLEMSKVNLAWNTIRRPVDTFFDSPTKDEWLAGAASDLRAAMSALRQAEAMLPFCSSARRAAQSDHDS